jgi:predicted MFS family arabinose efflux permease
LTKGKWITEKFQIQIDHVGYIMIVLGLGNLAGSLMIVPLFLVLPSLPWIWAICIVYFAISVILNVLTPVIAQILLSINPEIRRTITSLTNSTMNASVTLGSWMSGFLYALMNGFSAVGIFAVGCLALFLIALNLSGVFVTQEITKEKLSS